MALSNKFGEMLLTTGNKSEVAVGYATIYGDMAGGYNPIKDLYKTRVFETCRWRNANHRDWMMGPAGEVIPPRVIDKPPTAELRDDQKDSDSLPPIQGARRHPRSADRRRASVAEVVAMGFDRDVVKKVEHLIYHRRIQALPVRPRPAPDDAVVLAGPPLSDRQPLARSVLNVARRLNRFLVRMHRHEAAKSPDELPVPGMVTLRCHRNACEDLMAPKIAVYSIPPTAPTTTWPNRRGCRQGRGADVRLRRFAKPPRKRSSKGQDAWKSQLEEWPGIPEVALDDMEWADGYFFSAPTRYGVVASQMRAFIDTLGRFG